MSTRRLSHTTRTHSNTLNPFICAVVQQVQSDLSAAGGPPTRLRKCHWDWNGTEVEGVSKRVGCGLWCSERFCEVEVVCCICLKRSWWIHAVRWSDAQKKRFSPRLSPPILRKRTRAVAIEGQKGNNFENSSPKLQAEVEVNLRGGFFEKIKRKISLDYFYYISHMIKTVP